MLDLVAAFTDPGDLVWDPYCGSGTTGVACLRLGRRFIGHEMQPHYAKIAAERLEAETRGLTLQDVRRGQTSILDRFT
jgi:site-specific DNA-methyltransferase (adenine-specific)